MEEQVTFEVGDKIVLKDTVSFWQLERQIELLTGKEGIITEIMGENSYKCIFTNPNSTCQIWAEKLQKLETEEGKSLSDSYTDPGILTQEGRELYKKDRLEESIGKYKQALEIDPSYAMARYNLGHSYKAQGELKKAILQWERGLTQGVATMALARSMTGDIDRARRLLEEQVESGQPEMVQAPIETPVKDKPGKKWYQFWK